MNIEHILIALIAAVIAYFLAVNVGFAMTLAIVVFLYFFLGGGVDFPRL